MLAPILDRILYFNLGPLGRAVVWLIENNIWLFASLFVIYGGLVLYAKIIWSEYLPRKMTAFLQNVDVHEEAAAALYTKWLVYRKQLPKYILVPTQNELWVKSAARMTGKEKKLFYNTEKDKLNEEECFFKMLKTVMD